MNKMRMGPGGAVVALALGSTAVLAAPAAGATDAVIAAPAPTALLAQEPGGDAAEAGADSVFREARAALREGDHRTAARMFNEARTRYPDSPEAADAYYWEAFSLYRAGGADELRRALAALEAQAESHPDAATRGDARELATRIRGELARLGDADAAERVVEQASQAAESCPEEDTDIRLVAMQALMNMDEERAMPILREVVARRDPCSEPLRRRAVFLIADAGGEQAADLLLQVARDDPSPEVRRQAVFWLSEVDSERAVDLLGEVLRGGGDRELKEAALFALSEHESGRAGAILRAYAENASAPAELRARALFMIGQHGTPESTRFLRELYPRLDTPELREAILFSLAQSDAADPQWLLERALDPSEALDLRKRALFLAAEAGVSAERLGALYDGLEEKEMREQILFSLAEVDDSAAVDLLLQVAREEPDPELRKRAIFWLGESDDPRAAELLIEILEQ